MVAVELLEKKEVCCGEGKMEKKMKQLILKRHMERRLLVVLRQGMN